MDAWTDVFFTLIISIMYHLITRATWSRNFKKYVGLKGTL